MNKERMIWMAGGSILTIAIFIIAQQFFFGESSAEELSANEVTGQVEERFQAEVQSIQKNDNQFEVEIEESNGQYLVLVDAKEGTILDVELLAAKQDQTASEPESEDANDENQESETDENENKEENSSEQEEPSEPEQLLMTKSEVEEIVKNDYNGEITASELIEEEQPYFQIQVENEQETIQLAVDAETGDIEEQKRESNQPTIITENEAAQIALDQYPGELDDVELKQVDGTIYYQVEVEVERGDDDEDYILRINAISGEVISVTQDD